MKNLIGLENLKVVKSTTTTIRDFVWENRGELSSKEKLFYQDVASIVERNASKKKSDSSKISDMSEILERAYNIEKYVLAAGAASYEVQFETKC
jgi:hypothetical protein